MTIDLEHSPWRGEWALPPGVTYLNHGSFGPPPQVVRQSRRDWQQRLDCQPVDFFVRQFEPAWFGARQRLADFLGADAGNLAFAENATAAMNVVAASVPLQAGDEVLLTDHEYGAVQRIWRRAAERAAACVRTAILPARIESPAQVLDSLFHHVTDRTRLIVVSHITSPTAITLPVDAICHEARQRGVPVCVDGPHAVAQLPLHLDQMACAFYCASCHKWLCAPFGSGFLYVAPSHQAAVRPPALSWGRTPPAPLQHWSDEFVWCGTRDPSAYLTIPAAIEYLQTVGLELFRQRSHALARYARAQIGQLVDDPPITPDSPDWYGNMAHLPLPPGDGPALQRALWEQDRIEVPVIQWNDRRWIRISCHLYNTKADIDRLANALGRLVVRGGV